MQTTSQVESFEKEPPKYRSASLRTGAYDLIPIPFLDEWLIRRQRRQIVALILKERGISCDADALGALAGKSQTLLARIGSLFRNLIMKPVRKLFRTVFFWLAAKSAARTATETYLLARFLRHPGLLREADDNRLSRDRALALAAVFREVNRGMEMRAAKGAVRKVGKLFRDSRRASSDEVTAMIEKSAPGFVAEFDGMVGDRLEKLDA